MVVDLTGDATDDTSEASEASEATNPFRNPDTEGIDELDSFRPALIKLDSDIRDLEAELMRGFGSRTSLVKWTQQLCVYTLGWVDEDWFIRLAKQFRAGYDDGRHRTVISCLLAPHARQRSIKQDQADEVRRQIVTQTIRPAKRIAFRQLRSDAGEYAAEAGTGAEHDPAKQRYIAMRPAINEIDERQRSVLNRLLSPGGFDDREGILSWTRDLELATHGEIPEGFATRCYQERATRRALISDGDDYDRAREFFAAAYLIPVFNRGIADLAGRSKETAQAEREKTKPARI